MSLATCNYGDYSVDTTQDEANPLRRKTACAQRQGQIAINLLGCSTGSLASSKLHEKRSMKASLPKGPPQGTYGGAPWFYSGTR